jgi:Erythromycin esterase
VYDAVASYVQRVAPRLLPQLVKAVPHGPGDRGHALALQHARQIVAFYEYYTLDQPNYGDQKLAQNLRWWRRHTGDKVVFWAANVHTANARRLVATIPPDVLEFKAAGAYLREHYGSRYAPIGFTFDHGAVNSGWGGPAFTPRPFRCRPRRAASPSAPSARSPCRSTSSTSAAPPLQRPGRGCTPRRGRCPLPPARWMTNPLSRRPQFVVRCLDMLPAGESEGGSCLGRIGLPCWGPG